MNYPGIETMVWDLDGTLIDSFSIFAEITQVVLAQQGLQVPSIETLAENFHGNLEDSINNAAGGLSDRQLERVVAAFLNIQDGYYEAIEHHLFPDALALAKKAKGHGIRQIVVTNRMHEGRMNASPRNIVANSSLHSLIDEIICGDDGPHRKPLVEVFGGNEPPAESTLVIGDQYVDIMLAHNLGARAIIVNRGSETLQHLVKLHDTWEDHTTVVASLDELSFT